MARELILRVRSQWGELMTFVDTFYIELTMVAKFPPSQAWALVGRCVAAVFALMAPYRARVALLGDPPATPPRQIGLHLGGVAVPSGDAKVYTVEFSGAPFGGKRNEFVHAHRAGGSIRDGIVGGTRQES